jgi:hypothetical protein
MNLEQSRAPNTKSEYRNRKQIQIPQLFSRMEELTADDTDSADKTMPAACSLPERDIRAICEIRGLLHSA